MLCGCCRIAAAVGLGPMFGMAVAEDSGRQRLNPATATKPRVAGAVGSWLLLPATWSPLILSRVHQKRSLDLTDVTHVQVAALVDIYLPHAIQSSDYENLI